MNTLCIILGRAGSRGLTHKNSLPLGGRAMVAWTIDHARLSGRVCRVVLSTDSPAVAAAGHEYGIHVIDRPADLAGDTATVDSAARHALLETERRFGERYDAAVILYANVPLRPAGLVDRALEKLEATGCDSVQSVYPVGKNHPWWMKTLEGVTRDELAPFHSNAVYRRQDLPPVYMLDGGVIAVRRESLMREVPGEPHAFLGTDRRAIVTAPGEVVDIDSAADLAVARAMLRGRGPEAMAIGSRRVGPGEPVYVIAELGVNHDGSVERALALTDAAKAAGADAVKLQLFDAGLLMSGDAEFAAYQRGSASDPPNPLAMLQQLQLSVADMRRVAERARQLGLGFIVTCFSPAMAPAMRDLNLDAVKLASPDLVNGPLIDAVLELGKPLLLSTGAATLAEVAAASHRCGDHPAALLHCVSSYPTPADHANLGRIESLAAFGRVVGYSDHTTELHMGMLAAARGAQVIEKHLTHDRLAPGPDHAASFDPAQFSEYVELIRSAAAALAPRPDVQEIERDVRRVSRQSLCTTTNLPAGHVIRPGDLTIKRPGTGIPASELEAVIGRTVRRAVEANRLLRADDLEG